MCIDYTGGCRPGGVRVTERVRSLSWPAPRVFWGREGATPVQMEKRASHPNRKAKEESNAVPLCRAKPSPSFINLQASSPLATFLNVRTAKLPSGSLLCPLHLCCSPFRSRPQAQGMPGTSGTYVCQSPSSDPARPTTDGYFGKFTSIYDTSGSWEGKKELCPPGLTP
ncbi:TSSK6-activating co-chaperone protein isoform X1 [Panthera pardus]|uniref:TSSK6-activating co-chaperone protein isoform X1 n=1 Tax=Panthera pardus TaxID=9691 RepID=A0A9W2W1I0_PANPR|nr:TSSK6-activating co-chaperone protein isoform X1 [Panthera pardus]